MIDPTFRITPPPVDVALTPLDLQVAQGVITIGSAIILAGLVYAAREWKRTGSPIPVLLIIGGAITNLAEPFVDLGGGCWFPMIGQDILFELMARPMPFWLLFAYTCYFGVLMMFLYTTFNRGVTKKAMWLWFVIPVIADIVLEECQLSLSDHMYIYYGNQPLRLHTFPIWWTAPNTMGIYLSGVVMTIFTPLLRGWKMAFALISTPLCYFGATGLVSVPSIVVINSDFPNWATQLGGILTFAFAALIVHGCTIQIEKDSPYNILSKVHHK